MSEKTVEQLEDDISVVSCQINYHISETDRHKARRADLEATMQKLMLEQEQAAATGGGMKAPQADDILRARMTVPLQKLLDLPGVETYAEIVPVVEGLKQWKEDAITTISKQDDRLRALRDQLNTREAEAKGLNRKVVELEKELHNKVNELKARGNKLAKIQRKAESNSSEALSALSEQCNTLDLFEELGKALCSNYSKDITINIKDQS